MIQAIVKIFFSIKKDESKKCITILKNRNCSLETTIERKFDRRRSLIESQEETCLTKYFKNIKGLNVKERAYNFARP